MKKISILTLINSSNDISREKLIKKILLFIENNFEVTIAFLEYEDLTPILYYLNDDMIIETHKYSFLPKKSKQLEVIMDIPLFSENNYFNEISVYAKVPIDTTEKEIGEIIFKIDDMETFSQKKDLINRLAMEIAFLLDYFELKSLKNDAVESLIKESQVNQKTENKLIRTQKEINLLKNSNDFGVLIIDLKLNFIENNDYINNILEINNSNKHNITTFLSQNEVYSNNFINYLNKLSKLERNSVTNISLVNTKGKELYFKVSGSFIKDDNQFFLKLFNTTPETILTKKYAKLKTKFNQLLKTEIEETIKTSDFVVVETLKFFENKDEDFGNHIERISEYSLVIAKYIFENNTLNEDIDQDYIDVLPRAAALHDIGMLSIKESILFKDDKFTKEEFMMVKNHTVIAAKMLDKLIEKTPNSIFLKLLKEIVLGHHERYNGEGYPYKLKGKQIPLSARIVAFADIFDGLTTDRIYKKGLDLDIARMMIVDYRAKLLDPDIVDIYLKIEDKFIEIHQKYNLS